MCVFSAYHLKNNEKVLFAKERGGKDFFFFADLVFFNLMLEFETKILTKKLYCTDLKVWGHIIMNE